MSISRRITAHSIEEARARVRAEFLDSRQIEDAQLSRALGAQLLAKIEIENPVGSFKGRGTDSFVGALSPDVKTLVTASAGNFGLALAYAAKRRGIRVTVYAAETASPIKLERIRAAGGILKISGGDFDEAKEYARTAAIETGSIFVEDGREPEITSGAGTMGMELTAGSRHIDTLVVPLGNGALLAGLGCWFRARSPKTRIVGVCAEGAPSMALSWRSHSVQSTPRVDTIADGIAVRVPVPEALADLDGVIDDIVLVSEDSIQHAMKIVYKHLRMAAEPAGVAGISALLSHSGLAKGLTATPITGGNVTQEQIQKWLVC